MPALKRAGAGAVGVFRNSIAPEGPFINSLVSYPDLAAYETVQDKLAADEDYRKQADAYYNDPQGHWLRAHRKPSSSRVFQGAGNRSPACQGRGPDIRAAHVRIEQPRDASRKVEMFQTGGEIAIFRKSGLLPVFFATTIVGTHMPNLTYMLAFDSLAAREHGWGVFGASPEWKELRARPGLSDIEMVSNISNIILTAAPGSEIR